MPNSNEELREWAEAHRAYVDAAEVVLGKERHGSHDLDVVEALSVEAQRALARYRASRGEA